MKVGLYDVDSKIPNLALMKIAAYHKAIFKTVPWKDYSTSRKDFSKGEDQLTADMFS